MSTTRIGTTKVAWRLAMVACCMTVAGCANAGPAPQVDSSKNPDGAQTAQPMLSMQLRGLASVSASQDQARPATPRQWTAADVPAAQAPGTLSGPGATSRERLIQVLSGRSVTTTPALAPTGTTSETAIQQPRIPQPVQQLPAAAKTEPAQAMTTQAPAQTTAMQAPAATTKPRPKTTHDISDLF